MPLFYFNLRSAKALERDESGIGFVSLEEAYLEAYRAVFTISDELRRTQEDPTRYAFEITDANGQLLLELPFSEALGCRTFVAKAAQREMYNKTKREIARSRLLREQVTEECRRLKVSVENARHMLRGSLP